MAQLLSTLVTTGRLGRLLVVEVLDLPSVARQAAVLGCPVHLVVVVFARLAAAHPSNARLLKVTVSRLSPHHFVSEVLHAHPQPQEWTAPMPVALLPEIVVCLSDPQAEPTLYLTIEGWLSMEISTV